MVDESRFDRELIRHRWRRRDHYAEEGDKCAQFDGVIADQKENALTIKVRFLCLELFKLG
jgi:hypothetical protein